MFTFKFSLSHLCDGGTSLKEDIAVYMDGYFSLQDTFASTVGLTKVKIFMYNTNDKSKQLQRLQRPTASQQCCVDRIIKMQTVQAGRVFVHLCDYLVVLVSY